MKKIKSRFRIDKKDGFTLIEILVVIGIIAILATVVLVAINPSRQFKLARDSQRLSNITAILNAVGQNMAEHKGVFYCDSSPLSIPLVATVIAKDSLASELDIAHCIIPNYISSMPFDPIKSDSYFTDITKYNTGYKILQDSSGRITVSADGEITNPISITR